MRIRPHSLVPAFTLAPPRTRICICVALLFTLAASSARAQSEAASGAEIPLQRCDSLPVVVLQINHADKRFLIDTAATSMLNEKSFPQGREKEVRVQSWNEVTPLKAREVAVSELSLGNHTLRGVRL